ncbi:50S ribosomal protein L29 [Patescibacteria group bacterium]|nr:50S ribosomal protein L29 [Patescibacteria group bacterium]MBU1755294.1 50S ribosomal protein L29 [Patescibacteria group bacterium]
MAKKTNYKEKNIEELTKLLAEKREEHRQIRFQSAGAKAKDSNASSKVRKEIARIMTELGVKDLA